MPDARPLRLEWVDPATLAEHPRNWRTHPAEQAAAFEGLLAEVGWADALLFNERSGRLLDGHMRRIQAIANRLPAVPVLVGSWDEAAEAKVLATRDGLGLMAGIDPVAWTENLKLIDTGSPELQAMLAGLTEDWVPDYQDNPRDGASAPDDEGPAGDDPAGPEAEEEPDTTAPDVVFPSDDDWDVPTLDPRMQGDAPQFPVTGWRTVGRRNLMPGTWSFYSDDYKFEPLWKDPGAILLSRPAYAFEPNFSTHPQMPLAKVLWDVFRKRWLNRFWQTKGLRTFVDLNVDPRFRAVNFRGVPRGWRAYSTRIHRDERDPAADWTAAAEHSGREDLAFVVYGGGPSIKKLCVDRGWFWVEDQCHRAREQAAEKRGTDGQG